MTEIEQAIQNENAQKYLRMLALAEGTYKNSTSNPYNVAFGGSTIADLSKHPGVARDFTQTDGKANKTTAAGAYQFIKPTWENLQASLKLPDFSPRSQDLAALELIRRNGALNDVLAGNFDAANKRNGGTWASLPSSPYAQPKRSQGFIEKALNTVTASAQAKTPNMNWDAEIEGFLKQQPSTKQGAQPNWDSEIDLFLKNQTPQTAPTPRKPKRSAFDDVLRQVGLTGRYALEGAGQAADVVAEPVNALVRWMGGNAVAPSKTAGRAADSLGLPKPESSFERVIGDATRTGFGAALPAGLAAKLAPMATSTIGRAVATGLAENPAAQIGGGAGSGAGSGLAREGGLNEWGQLAAGVVGGVGGGLAGNAAMRATSRASESVARRLGVDSGVETLKPRQMDDAQLSTALRNRLEITGGDWGAIPDRVKASVLQDVRKANNLENLDAMALQRLADFRALEVTPTRGTVTLDPVLLTQEKNLAKSGANSRLGSAQGLAQVEHGNNAQLIRQLQGLEGGREIDPLEAGRLLSGRISSQRDALRAAEQAAWDSAKASPGYRVPMQASVLSDVNAALGESAMMPFMDKNISAYMAALQANPEQFTPQAYQNLQSMLSRAMASGGNEAAAAGVARRVLESADLRPAATQVPNSGHLPVTARDGAFLRATDPMPGDAMSAIDAARRATRSAYAFEDSSPLVRKVLSDGSMSDPARIGKHILSATPDEAREIARHLDQQGLQMIRGALATDIKKRALGGASDELGKVSQKSLNSAISSIGREKLGLFFTPEEVQHLERVGRVAGYTQFQPAGSAVNNSNSGALLMGKGLDLLTGISSKIPLLNIDQQIDSLANWRGTSQALQAQRGLLSPGGSAGALHYPNSNNAGRGLAIGGLFAIPKDSDETKDHKRN